MKQKNKKSNIVIKLIVVAIFILAVAAIINLAPNYVRQENTGKINVIINNHNVTESMKFDSFVDDNDIVYLSTKDIANFFDEDIFYDNKYDQIITGSETKLAALKLNEQEMYVNSAKVKIYGAAMEKDNQFYLPFSEMKDVYNVEVTYIKETNIVTIDSLDREQKKANASKNISIKYKPTIFSATLEKVKQGESLYLIVENARNGWHRVRTSKGRIGYTKDLTNIYVQREEIKASKQVDGKVSIVWDYYTNKVPNRTETEINGINVISPSFVELIEQGKGDINVKIDAAGQEYINWAHSQNNKVWAIVSNNGYSDTTSQIVNDYKIREKLINNIIKVVIQYNLDGINLDFENVKQEDKDMLSRFIIELAPRLKEYGKTLSVDVTAPDGGTDWSESYNRNKIGKVADYVVFMAYDQYGNSSPKAGTTAGADWIEVNIKKFIEREEVPAEKLILGMPFYTRLWEEKTNGDVSSQVIWMKSIESNIPSNAQKTWNESLQQNYVEYTKGTSTYKMWIEDEASLKAKFALMKKYNLVGAAYWQKDFEDPNIWNLVAEEMK